VRDALPDIVGTEGARLVLRGSGDPIGPPSGSVHVRGRWAAGRSSGEAEVLLFPVSEALCEIHVTLHPGGSLPRLSSKLTRLAGVLARAVAEAAAMPATRQEREERRTAGGTWVFVPATGTRSH
jgi:hypothetical protein